MVGGPNHAVAPRVLHDAAASSLRTARPDQGRPGLFGTRGNRVESLKFGALKGDGAKR